MVYGEAVLKAMAVYKWVARYKEERESLEDDSRLRRPISTHNNENVKRIDELIATNRRTSNRYIAIGMSNVSIIKPATHYS